MMKCLLPNRSGQRKEHPSPVDANSSNATIGHSEKAQEHIYVIDGELILHTEIEDNTLTQGDSLYFDFSTC